MLPGDLGPDVSSVKSSKKAKGKERARTQGEEGNEEEHGNTTTTPKSRKRKRATSKPEAPVQATSSDFKAVQAVMKLPVAPIFSDDALEGVRQSLESWIMRYIPSIDAVLLSVTWPPEFIEENAPLVNSSAFGLAQVRWEGVGFRPQIGHTTTGKLSLATPSVISLLLHNLFNASISADHIPKDRYEWDPEAKLPYSLASTGLVRGVQSQSQGEVKAASTPGKPSTGQTSEEHEGATSQMIEGEEVEAEPKDGAAQDEGEENEDDGDDDTVRGCWVDKETREPLGGFDGEITFKVIGLTIANSMISVQGSLLDDPLPTILKAERKEKKAKK